MGPTSLLLLALEEEFMDLQATDQMFAGARPGRMPRLRTIVYWAATAPVLLETAVGAEWDLARIPYVREIIIHLGYPLYLLTIIGVAKVLAVMALVAPRAGRVKDWAYAGVFFVYAGAAASHFAAGDGVDKIAAPLIFSALTLVSAGLWGGIRPQ
jgi:hypothetical protein